ncbi:hypothetical protein GCM10014713_60580 [Streptomyces purpureus]|uniref:Uncharacterized protein n=1 Tax=Streptomyces purpureus TaxID=1951 RepID=A0A918HEJ3_9ACTN|nr:hypothetical protein GCM10014713_60580 [Streptomyces purpureus]
MRRSKRVGVCAVVVVVVVVIEISPLCSYSLMYKEYYIQGQRRNKKCRPRQAGAALNCVCA